MSKRWRSGTSHPIKNLMWLVQEEKCFFCFKPLVKRVKRGHSWQHCLLTVDHLVPRTAGGVATVVAACWQCNHDKGECPPTKEQLLDFKALVETSIYMGLARNYQKKAVEEVDYWLANLPRLQGMYSHE